MDFAAIDFETANEKIYSVCSLGVVVVEGGQVAERVSWLIRPPELYFGRYNTYIHGICKQDVFNKPQFNQLWPTIKSYLEGRTIVAHSAGFDIGALRSVLDVYAIPYPELHYSCTRIISKNTWPGLLSYGLASVADYLGIEFRHHDAEEDAFASAEIARRACKKLGARSLQDLANRLEIVIGRLFPGGNVPSRPRSQQFNLKLVPSSRGLDPEHPFYGQTFAFTGRLKSMRRQEAMQRVVDVGGICATAVTEYTNFVVMGDQDLGFRFKDERKSTKIKKAEFLISLGINIEVLAEEEFLRMLEE